MSNWGFIIRDMQWANGESDSSTEFQVGYIQPQSSYVALPTMVGRRPEDLSCDLQNQIFL